MLCDRFKLNLACQLKIHERYLPLGKAEYCVAQHAAQEMLTADNIFVQ